MLFRLLLYMRVLKLIQRPSTSMNSNATQSHSGARFRSLLILSGNICDENKIFYLNIYWVYQLNLELRNNK